MVSLLCHKKHKLCDRVFDCKEPCEHKIQTEHQLQKEVAAKWDKELKEKHGH